MAPVLMTGDFRIAVRRGRRVDDRTSPDHKSCVLSGRLVRFNAYVEDASTARARPERALYPIDSLTLTHHIRVHTAIWRVANPPRDAFPNRGFLCKPPKPDTLDAATDDQPTCDTHACAR